MTAAIQVDNVTKHFRIPHSPHATLRGRILHPLERTQWEEFTALRDVSFQVRRGEFFGIVGRNGSGKSTLLKSIAGIYRPDAGTIAAHGSMASFIELGVGFNAELSGRENLFINGALLGLSRRELRRRYDSIVDFAELHEFMDLKLRNYSSGMQVRLAFSVALESGSDILLTDEVLAVGDERFQSKCFDVFREYKRQGRTIVFVSHDMGVVQQFCDRAALLERGVLQDVDEAWKITQAYHRVNAPVPVYDADRADPDAAVEFIAFNVAQQAGHSTDLLPGEPITVRVRARFRTAITAPAFGVTLRTLRGQAVCTMTTKATGNRLSGPAAGDELEVAFRFENRLAGGTYLARWWVEDQRGARIHDRANEDVVFTVRGDHDEAAGVLRPSYQLLVEESLLA